MLWADTMNEAAEYDPGDQEFYGKLFQMYLKENDPSDNGRNVGIDHDEDVDDTTSGNESDF
jgi:hypothetical protein